VNEIKPEDKNNPKVLSLNMNICSPNTSRANVVDVNANILNNNCILKQNANPEEFVCSICLTFVPAGIGAILKTCNHTFCIQCLKKSIFSEHDKSGVVMCPLRIENCDKQIDEQSIKDFLGDADYKVFLDAVSRKAKENNDALLLTLLGLEDLPIIESLQVFECPICFETTVPGDGMILRNCLHTFCKACIVELVKSSEEYIVPCPYTENNRPCSEEIRECEIKYLVPEDVFKKHLYKSIEIAERSSEKAFHCRSPDCHYFIEIENPDILCFKCEICLKINCIKCKAQHEGKTCFDYQEDVNPDARELRLKDEQKKTEETIAVMVAAGTAMICPKCGISVEKIAGCDFVQCTACKLGLCWVTKKPRNDLHKDGLVIPGCGCKVNGVLCHPQCGNCH
jgi:RanBP-type and C3HC4-type zinc finger-containing protein 1